MEFIEIRGRALADLLDDLGVPEDRRPFVLRLSDDGEPGIVKYKINEYVWSPPYEVKS